MLIFICFYALIWIYCIYQFISYITKSAKRKHDKHLRNEQFDIAQQNAHINDLLQDTIDQQLSDDLLRQQQELNRQFTEDSLANVTPFEMGGLDMNQGNSWNNLDAMDTFYDFNNDHFNDFSGGFGMFQTYL